MSDEEGSCSSPRPALPAGRAAQKKKAARRALIARTAPHLLDVGGESSSSPLVTTSPSAGGSRSPSGSALASPVGSDADAATPSGLGSAPPRPSRSHVIPKGFRGPPPREGDAEEIAPAPSLLPTPGSATLYLTSNTPTNRNGWRYTPAGPASSSLPTSVYRTLEMAPHGVHWSWADRSPFTKISSDARTICSDRGFRSARVNVPVREGAWYCEMQILPPEPLQSGVGGQGSIPAPMGDGAHVRLGWGRREAGLNAPTGFDGYSYGLRDTTGERVFLSRPAAFASRNILPGDTVGLYIRLPPIPAHDKARQQQEVRRKRIPIRYKGQVYFESLEYAPSKEMEALMESSRKGLFRWPGSASLSSVSTQALISGSSAGAAPAAAGVEAAPGASSKKRRLKNQAAPAAAQVPVGRPLPTLGPTSRIGFFINGEPQGIAFEDLLDFRPLAAAPSAPPVKGKKGGGGASLGLAGEDAVITSTSTLATIMKSRENTADDGALGYFAMASCFGGARVRLATRLDEFAFAPPQDIEAALEAANGEATCALGTSCKDSAPAWRALGERYDAYLEEQWAYDEQDEVRAEAAWQVMRHKLDSDEDEDATSTTIEAPVAAPRKKYNRSHKRRSAAQRERSGRKHDAALAKVRGEEQQQRTARDTMSPTPLRQSLFSSPGPDVEETHTHTPQHMEVHAEQEHTHVEQHEAQADANALGDEDAPGEDEPMEWQPDAPIAHEAESMQLDQ